MEQKYLCLYAEIMLEVLNMLPPQPNNIGKKGKMKYTGTGKSVTFKIVDEVSHQAYDDMRKVHYLQKLEQNDGTIILRLCSYVIRRTGKKDKWVYGQFAPIITMKDLTALVKKAKSKF